MNGIKNWLQRNGFGKGAIFFFLMIFIMVAALAGNMIYNSVQQNYTINKETKKIHLPLSVKEVPSVTVYNVAYALDAQGIMDAETFSYKFEKITGWKVNSRTVKSGYYTIPPKTSMKELLNILGIKGKK